MPAARDMSIRIIAAAAGVIGFAAPAANAADVVKIGTPLALTGSLADEGKKQDVVWNMWLAKVNAAGGMNVGGKKMKVELVKYDYQSDGRAISEVLAAPAVVQAVADQDEGAAGRETPTEGSMPTTPSESEKS